MMLQSLIVFIVVAGCFAYAAWTLLPQAVRRAVANALLHLPLPRSWVPILQKTASAAAGCHCSGCDQAQPRAGQPGQGAKGSPPATKALVFYPRKRQ